MYTKTPEEALFKKGEFHEAYPLEYAKEIGFYRTEIPRPSASRT